MAATVKSLSDTYIPLKSVSKSDGKSKPTSSNTLEEKTDSLWSTFKKKWDLYWELRSDMSTINHQILFGKFGDEIHSSSREFHEAETIAQKAGKAWESQGSWGKPLSEEDRAQLIAWEKEKKLEIEKQVGISVEVGSIGEGFAIIGIAAGVGAGVGAAGGTVVAGPPGTLGGAGIGATIMAILAFILCLGYLWGPLIADNVHAAIEAAKMQPRCSQAIDSF
jgi:hypothetical protein